MTDTAADSEALMRAALMLFGPPQQQEDGRRELRRIMRARGLPVNDE